MGVICKITTGNIRKEINGIGYETYQGNPLIDTEIITDTNTDTDIITNTINQSNDKTKKSPTD